MQSLSVELNGAIAAIALLLLVIQVPALAVLLSRLLQGPRRHSPLQPQPPLSDLLGTVSIVVPTLNEAARIGPCLDGLSRQSYEVREIIVVDSRSQDGTPELVKAVGEQDPRIRLITDDPLPPGWVGRPWALHTGFLHSSADSQWVLGIDADTRPQPGLVSSLIQTARRQGYDLVSLAPQFILKELGEFWLQPALLMTLVYRFGPAGGTLAGADRVMANGQCFLCKRSLLVELDGYTSARSSFCDDVTLARHAARHGATVGFLDGSQLLKVRMYEGAVETWREWGRSLDLKDASSIGQKWGDLGFLVAVQGLPLLSVLGFAICLRLGYTSLPVMAVLVLNSLLLLMRVALLWAIAPSYDFTQAKASWSFWLSPLADPLAVYRIYLSSIRTPTQWRGRSYS
ncbi:2'-O-glycosyltransferase CruG [Thermocoleostomius sinensis]|uniref:4,4'-diaponeurosporenoate glycosyltransferase n=1 Tax=Thermocoleostomius sinensis A174 TaxID=2016057 RepID=A0A9E9CBB0_9CYAN|nr:glycosyltransferase family 2 protein [Thermocoleostomius sinensis]WAL62072.1 glycosyltransferase family 2 protein [Thermocoleostomius sinensis A174]